MTPKEKAKELVDRFDETLTYLESKQKAKQCALIAVEEILNTLYSIPFGNALDNELEYYQEVKQEIEKL
jgi:hypothetical protein